VVDEEGEEGEGGEVGWRGGEGGAAGFDARGEIPLLGGWSRWMDRVVEGEKGANRLCFLSLSAWLTFVSNGGSIMIAVSSCT